MVDFAICWEAMKFMAQDIGLLEHETKKMSDLKSDAKDFWGGAFELAFHEHPSQGFSWSIESSEWALDNPHGTDEGFLTNLQMGLSNNSIPSIVQKACHLDGMPLCPIDKAK